MCSWPPNCCLIVDVALGLKSLEALIYRIDFIKIEPWQIYHNQAGHIELLWPSGYELQLSLERSWVLILVKVIGG